MCGIGEVARSSGLTVSALRFYDRVGLLVPAFVDPQTGYRWYGRGQLHSARLVAGMRRVGMPVPEIARVLAQHADPAGMRRSLDAHLRRLEDGLADARREFSRIHALIEQEENAVTALTTPTRLTLAGADFVAAFNAVRFAVGTDAKLPVLGGIRLEVADTVLRLVATDRYRLAVAESPARDVSGPRTGRTAAVGLLDKARASMVGDEDVTVVFDGADIVLRAAGWQVSEASMTDEFPDYRRLVRTRDAHTVPVDVAAFRQLVAAGATRRVVRDQDGVSCEVTVLTLDAAGQLAVAAADDPGIGERLRVGVNREFLLEALAASGRGQLLLELDGPITPLAVRIPDDEGTFSILMPTKL